MAEVDVETEKCVSVFRWFLTLRWIIVFSIYQTSEIASFKIIDLFYREKSEKSFKSGTATRATEDCGGKVTWQHQAINKPLLLIVVLHFFYCFTPFFFSRILFSHSRPLIPKFHAQKSFGVENGSRLSKQTSFFARSEKCHIGDATLKRCGCRGLGVTYAKLHGTLSSYGIGIKNFGSKLRRLSIGLRHT